MSCRALPYRCRLALLLAAALWNGSHVEAFAGIVPFCRMSTSSKLRMNAAGNPNEEESNPSGVQALKSFVRLAERLPDRSRYEGKSTYIPEIPVESNDLLAWLLQNSEPAPFGEGTETVQDEAVRKTLQIIPNDRCMPQWDGLPQALQEISEALTPGIRLDAELDKILIYRPGDFFLEHCDSKKSENHTMTMSVLCGGYSPVGRGAVCFRNPNDNDDEEIYVNGVDRNCWEVVEAGSYACWFNTEPHRVMQVKGGYRVILQYNVIVVERVTELNKVVHERWAKRPWNFPSSWRNEFPTILGAAEKDLAEVFWISDESHPYNLFVHFLQREKQTMLNAIKKKSFARSKLGLLLKHEYSLDGTLQVPRLHLRGSDAWLCAALSKVFGNNMWTTRRAILWTTVDQGSYYAGETRCNLYDEYDREMLLEARVFQEITENQIGRWGERPIRNVPSEYFHLLPSGKREVTENALWVLQEPTGIETDGWECKRVKETEDPTFAGFDALYWPFFRTLFLIRDGDLSRVTTTRMTNGKREGYVRWGNQYQYEVFAYTTVALVLDLEGENDSDSETEDPTLDLNRVWWDRNRTTKDDMITLLVPDNDGDENEFGFHFNWFVAELK